MGRAATDDKSNEIAAIPEDLWLVDLRGAIATIDAMGTRRAIARQVVDPEADFVLALKKPAGYTQGRGRLYPETDVKRLSRHRCSSHRYHRNEARPYRASAVRTDAWPEQLAGVASSGRVALNRHSILRSIRDGKETNDMRYFISSLPVKVKQLTHAVRSDSSIENGCHWCLGLTYREVEVSARDVCPRENLAWLNRLTLSLLKQHPSKASVVMKRRACDWDDDFMLEVFTGMRG